MPVAEAYRKQVALLIKTVPLVAAETAFALKGGTAINLFLRDMPRLSVDIDLTCVPVADRESSLKEIDAALHHIKKQIGRGIPGARVSTSAPKGGKYITKLIVRSDDAQIKIEVTPVLRGCVYEPAVRWVSARVEEEFGFAETAVVSFADLYAGKIVAALDRQHPRDLFDVRDLLTHEGIDDNLRQAFIVYLLSHDRPMAEILAPTRRDISAEYKRGEPDWALLDLPGVRDLPAVRWKLENLKRLSPEKRTELLMGLTEALRMGS
jgi:predicted nucleotidyltransferase component of viral defense system